MSGRDKEVLASAKRFYDDGGDVSVRERGIFTQWTTAVAIIIAIIGGTYFTSQRLSQIDNRLSQLEQHQNDTWTKADHQMWAIRFAAKNRDLIVPDTQ